MNTIMMNESVERKTREKILAQFSLLCSHDVMKKLDLNPKRILRSGNRTIVFWADGTKTVVKRSEDEQDSPYNAFLAALGIHVYGSNSALKRIVARTETQKIKECFDDIGEGNRMPYAEKKAP